MFDDVNNNDAEELVIQDVSRKRGKPANNVQLVTPEPQTAPQEPKAPQGLVDGLNYVSNHCYHSDRKYLSSSVLKKVLESLEDYHREYILGEKPAVSSSTQANFDVGTLTHTLILEPHLAADSYYLYKGMVKRGQEWDRFVSSVEDKTLPILSINQVNTANALFDCFNKLDAAKNLVAKGEPELTICGTLHGVPIKTRFDWINAEQGFIADVKTTGYGSDLESFKDSFANFQYDLSAALYLQMAEQYYGKPFDFYFIVLSKKDKTCDVYKLSDKTRSQGETKVLQASQIYLEAKRTNVWTNRTTFDKLDSDTRAQDVQYKIKEI